VAEGAGPVHRRSQGALVSKAVTASGGRRLKKKIGLQVKILSQLQSPEEATSCFRRGAGSLAGGVSYMTFRHV
jgi:hypothetical protein